jgi:hypothetical protein
MVRFARSCCRFAPRCRCTVAVGYGEPVPDDFPVGVQLAEPDKFSVTVRDADADCKPDADC